MNVGTWVVTAGADVLAQLTTVLARFADAGFGIGVINRLAICDYRSLRNVVLDLGALTVVTGANGSGKSSLYRALRLLQDVAQGRIIASLAAEGGLTPKL